MNEIELSEMQHNKEELAGLQSINRMKNKRANPFFAIIGFGTLGLVAIFIALVFFWKIYPYNLMDYKGEYKMEKTSYVQGDETFYVTDYCKNTDEMPSIKKEFVDGLVFTSDSPHAFFTRGCRIQENRINIPHTLPVGRYRLRITTNYQVNPIRNLEYINFSNWFTVTEEK